MEQIKYEIARTVIKKMLKAGLINQEEFERIDAVNKERFAVKAA